MMGWRDKSEVLARVNIKVTVIWDVFCWLLLQKTEENSRSLRNVGTYLNYKSSQPEHVVLILTIMLIVQLLECS